MSRVMMRAADLLRSVGVLGHVQASQNSLFARLCQATPTAAFSTGDASGGAPGDVKLYIGNLGWETREADIRDMFSQYGSVVDLQMVTDKLTGRFRGFAFITMSAADAQKAKTADGQEMQGRAMRVNEAQPMSDRPPRTAGYGGGRGGGRGGGGGGYGGGGGGYNGGGGGGGYGGGRDGGDGGGGGGGYRGRDDRGGGGYGDRDGGGGGQRGGGYGGGRGGGGGGGGRKYDEGGDY